MRELEARINNILAGRKRLQEMYQRNKLLTPKEMLVTSHDERLLQKTTNTIETHIEEPDLSVEFLGKEVGLSRVHLYRKLKALTGLSPADFVKDFRLKRAAQLLSQKNLKVAEVAYAVGFQDVAYFSKCFKKMYGESPTQYAENLPVSDSR